jgi:hypothetical protein
MSGRAALPSQRIVESPLGHSVPLRLGGLMPHALMERIGEIEVRS